MSRNALINVSIEENKKDSLMERLLIYTLLSLLFFSCEDNTIVDHGKWISIAQQCDSIVDGYALIDEKVYYGSFDSIFFTDYLKKNGKGFLIGVDIETFELCQGTNYARDKNHVYYPIEVKCVEGWSYGGCYVTNYLLPKARPDKFKFLRDGYAISGDHMYWRGEEIVWREDILDETVPITDSIIHQNITKEKSYIDRLKEIHFEISAGSIKVQF